MPLCSLTPMGRRRALAVSPTGNRVEIDRALDRTSECRDYLSESGSFGLSGIEDPDAAFAQLQIEATSLEPQQILLLERFMAVGGDLRVALTRAEVRERYPQLSSVAAHIPDLRRLHASIAGKILPNGEMDDRASPGLLRIRREMQDRRGRIHRSLESMMRAQSKAVQEEIVTFRNGRFVIPVRTEARGQVPGVMHGLSSSGQTSYVEPLAIIDQNNELVRLHEEEETEIARILLEQLRLAPPEKARRLRMPSIANLRVFSARRLRLPLARVRRGSLARRRALQLPEMRRLARWRRTRR